MDSMYHSFLVRFWTSENNEDPIWHISLESSKTREKRFFTNLEDLVDYFETLMKLPSALSGNPQVETAQQILNTTKTSHSRNQITNE